jgi:thioredoxin 1
MPEGTMLQISDADFDSEVLQAELPVLVDFWAPWCGPCRMISPVIEKIAKEYEGRLKVCKINIDEHRQKAADSGVASIPTIHIYKKGRIVGQIKGVTPKFEADLKRILEPHVQ